MKGNRAIWQSLLNVCEVLVPLTGIFVWHFIKDFRIKAFVIYSLFVVVSELSANYFRKLNMKTEITFFYNHIVIPVEFLFIVWFLFSYMPFKKKKYLLLVFCITGVGSQVVDIFFLKKGNFYFSSFFYIVSTLVLLITILLLLWRFIQIEGHLQYDRHFVLWVAIASLIYYLGTFPLYAFYNYLYEKEKNVFYIYWYIMMTLNMCMYLLFSIGLIWTSIKYKYSLD